MGWLNNETIEFGDLGDTVLTRVAPGVLELRTGATASEIVGKRFYVDAENGSDTNNGQSSALPFATIGAAIDAAVSGRGDIIYIAPGSYDENVVVDKDYISLVGNFVSGYARPDIVPASGKALYVNAAQGFASKHVRYAAPAADVDLALIEGNGFILEDNVFDGDATQGDAKGLLRLKGHATDDSYTASEGIISGNLFRGSGGFGVIFDTAAAEVGVGSSDNVLKNNKFVGNDKADIVTADTGAGLYSAQRTQIGPGNVFADKNKTAYIDLTTSNGGAASDQTGIIVDNFFAADAITTTEVKMVGTGFTFVGNRTTVGIKDGSALD